MAKNKIIQIVTLPLTQIMSKYPVATSRDRLIISLDTSKIWVDIDGVRYIVANLGLTLALSASLKQDIKDLKNTIGFINDLLMLLVGE